MSIPLKPLIITGVLSCAVTLGVTGLAWELFLRPPTIVSFDLKGTTNKFLTQSAKLNLNEQQQQVLLSRYNENISRVLTQRATREKEVIVVQAAAAAGVKDITPWVEHELSVAMKGGR